MRMLVDINVLLDVVLRREPWSTPAVDFFRVAHRDKVELCLSSMTVTTLFYVAGRQAAGGDPDRRQRVAFLAVDRALSDFTIVAVDLSILLEARAMPGADFEDNVQMACARACRADRIVTRDAVGFARSLIKSVDPAEATRLIDIEGRT